jgi:hypothetical protein
MERKKGDEEFKRDATRSEQNGYDAGLVLSCWLAISIRLMA